MEVYGKQLQAENTYVSQSSRRKTAPHRRLSALSAAFLGELGGTKH